MVEHVVCGIWGYMDSTPYTVVHLSGAYPRGHGEGDLSHKIDGQW